MEDFEEYEGYNLVDQMNISRGVGLYNLDPVQVNTKEVFPSAPTVRIQNPATPMVDKDYLIDVDSELQNITRINSKDPNVKFDPVRDKTISLNYRNINDGFFHEDSTRLTNPAFELKGLTKNRWDYVFNDPQKNVIEPDFIGRRTGHNTYLDLLDSDESCEKSKPLPSLNN